MKIVTRHIKYHIRLMYHAFAVEMVLDGTEAEQAYMLQTARIARKGRRIRGRCKRVY